LILGNDEVEKGIVNLKDLVSGEQKLIPVLNLSAELKKEINS
jgi:histidyl-tRNA synthetase